MEVPLKPELEAKLARIAAQNGRPSEQVIEELVEKFVDHDDLGRGLLQYALLRGLFVGNRLYVGVLLPCSMLRKSERPRRASGPHLDAYSS